MAGALEGASTSSRREATPARPLVSRSYELCKSVAMEVHTLLSSVEIIDAEVLKHRNNEVHDGVNCVPLIVTNCVSFPEDEQEIELDEVVSKQDIVKVDEEPSLLLYVKPDKSRRAVPRKSSQPARTTTRKEQEGAADASTNCKTSLVRSITNSLRCVKKLKDVQKCIVKNEADAVTEKEVESQDAVADKIKRSKVSSVSCVTSVSDFVVGNSCSDNESIQDCKEIAVASVDGGDSIRNSDCQSDCDDDKQESEENSDEHCRGVYCNSVKDEHELVHLKENQGCKEKGQDHVCKICAAAFSHRSHLATHMRKHDSERRFECNECGSCFKTKSSVYFHMKCHAEAPFVCEICSKEYPERKKLMRHVRIIHASMDRYPCRKCGKAFNTRQKYKLHKTLHTGQKPFVCDLCQKAFVYKSTFVQHMHTHELHKAFKCDLCPKEYAICADFRKHYRNHSENRPFECPSCAKSFALKGTLKNHMKTHDPEKPFKCKLCEKSFMKKESYECHMMVHNGEQPKYLCDQCSMSYYNIFALKRHYVKHTGERKFSCTVCSRAFWMKDALNVHMRVHSNVKLFPCAQCPKAFSHKHTLESHLRTHQNNIPNVCPFCQKTFIHKGNFCRHIQLHEHKSS